jgi:hypothetical protein
MNPLVYQGFKLIDTPGWWIMAQTIALQHFEPLSTIVIPEEPDYWYSANATLESILR